MSKKKKVWIAFSGIVLLAVIIFFSVNAAKSNAVLVQTSKVLRKDVLTSKVTASGDIRAKRFVDLQTEVTGVITELLVHEGDSVRKGDILLRIDPVQTDAEKRIAQAQFEQANAEFRAQEFEISNAESNLLRDEASLRSSRAELEQRQNNYTRALNNYRRIQQLHEDGVESRDKYEIAQNEMDSAKSLLDVSKSNLSQMETQINIAKNNIERLKASRKASQARKESAAASLTKADDSSRKTTITAPLDGIITKLNKEKGERAVPGMLSNPEATIMTIADLSTIQAELKVDETDIVNLSLGNVAQVKVDALPEVAFEGEVTEIGNSPIQASGSSTQEAKDFKVIVTLKSPSSKLRPGMSCTSDITTDTKKNALAIPIQALTVREVEVDKDGKYHEPDLTKKKSTPATSADSKKDKALKKELEGVFVINKNNVARFRNVKTGITGESEIEVLENLKDGEEIVSGSFQTLRTIKDGAVVKIDNIAKSQTDKKS
jgi:HlyD family secretion protein